MRWTIEKIEQIANERGGICLSKEYVNIRQKISFKCNNGHIWGAYLSNINSGTWCPVCARIKTAESQRLTIEEMNEIAKKRGGECLSIKYKNVNSRLEWRCKENHIWKATPSNIKNGSWCPMCSSGFGESICRAYFEKIFNKSFMSIWPNWLINNNGNRMQLDGYCPDLKLAFEHQGLQHFEKNSFYDKHYSLEQRQLNDEQKDKLCKKYNIKLIHIPEIPTALPIEKITKYIKAQCIQLDVDFPENILDIFVDLSIVYSSKSQKYFNELKLIVEQKNGKILSKFYYGKRIKLEFQCEKGHIWKTDPSEIKRGGWCSRCVLKKIGEDKLIKSFEFVKKMVEKRNGKCLSTKDGNLKEELIFQCANNHIWEAKLKNVRMGAWCHICSNFHKPYNLKQVKKIANEYNWICLSDKYINNKIKMQWQCCKNKHIRDCSFSDLKKNISCKLCKKDKKIEEKKKKFIFDKKVKYKKKENKRVLNRQKYFNELKILVTRLGGECLSDKYINSQTKMQFQCNRGHKWTAIPNNIKKGTWCPECKGLKKKNIYDINRILIKRNWKCLSDKYINNKDKLKWQCNKKHIWFATYNDVINKNTNCPQCSFELRYNIRQKKQHCQEVAQKRNGKCLSDKYIQSKVPLKWQCKEGHIWEASPNNIVRGTWCPQCAIEKKKKAKEENDENGL